MFSQIHEECGIFGMYDKSKQGNLASTIYYGLFALQHRGQEAAGIAVNNGGKISLVKNLGLVSDVFKENDFHTLQGDFAIGHVRYSAGEHKGVEDAQPINVNYAKGVITVAHNGAITNGEALREQLEQNGAIFHSNNDGEIICYLIARASLKCKSVEDAIQKVIPMLKGAYSLLIMTKTKLIALRDPLGIRPLCIGTIGENTVFSSESCALETVGAKFVRDVLPGEIVVCENGVCSSIKSFCSDKSSLCIFEHMYFARPDSIIDGQSVNEARINAGKFLAIQHPVDADLVIGVPDSGLCSAIGYSEQSKIPYGLGFVKNRYIGRTFIQPTQAMRERSVALKLNALESNLKGKRIVMIDDSIVRGTTLKNIVKMVKKAGAIEVHVRISSPQFLNPCFYGTDIPDKKDLACVKYSLEQLCKNIGADTLGFLELNTVDNIAPNSKLHFCKACFDAKYPSSTENIVDVDIY